MGRYLPSRPGWYSNPDDPRALRYWDGTAWTKRARPRPPWSTRAEAFEPSYDEGDRSVEGPVHPHELREPVASGAWSREWLSWRPRQAIPAWPRGTGPQSSRLSRPPRVPPPAKLGPARRPLLALACLVVIAVGVVVSSVAFISPYEQSAVVEASDQAAAVQYAAQANKECAATLPKYRATLAAAADSSAVAVAAHQVYLLSKRLGAIGTSQQLRGPLVAWLMKMQQFAADQARYASIVGPPARLGDGRLVQPRLSPGAEVAAMQARRDAVNLAFKADNFASNLGLGACRLELAVGA